MNDRLEYLKDAVLQLEKGIILKITDIRTSANIHTLRRDMLSTALTLGVNKVIIMILDVENVPTDNMTLQERIAYYYLLQEK